MFMHTALTAPEDARRRCRWLRLAKELRPVTERCTMCPFMERVHRLGGPRGPSLPAEACHDATSFCRRCAGRSRAVRGSPVTGRIFFDQVIHDNLDLGRPDRVSLTFDRRLVAKDKHAAPLTWRFLDHQCDPGGMVPAYLAVSLEVTMEHPASVVLASLLVPASPSTRCCKRRGKFPTAVSRHRQHLQAGQHEAEPRHEASGREVRWPWGPHVRVVLPGELKLAPRGLEVKRPHRPGAAVLP